MRGSPLLRTFFTAIGLGIAAWPLWRISRSNVMANDVEFVAPVPAAAAAVPFQLQLSAAAKHVELLDENAQILWQANDPQHTEFFAELKRLPAHISIKITWSDTPAPHYFVKLRLDAPGRESLVHVFDASGDIDDLWELP